MILHEGPQVLGMGFDFAIFWTIGKAILGGTDPYAVWGSFYPPAMSYAYALFALLPISTSYVLWIVASIGSLVAVVGIKRAPAWLLFAPVLNVLAAGQVDLIFVALATQLRKSGWKSVLAAALITLKPQMALILLPWFMARWLLRDRRHLGAVLLTTAGLHAWPFLLDPGIGARWLSRMSGFSGAARGFSSPSIWAIFGGESLPLFLAAGVLIFLVGLILNVPTSRSANLLALPTAMYYDACALAGSAPAWALIPLSWVALIWAHSAGNFAPLMLVPLASFLWNVRFSVLIFGRREESERWTLRFHERFATFSTPRFSGLLLGGHGVPLTDAAIAKA